MRGLVFKDFILLKKQMKYVLIAVAIIAVNIVASKDLSFLVPAVVFMFSILSITSFSYDELEMCIRDSLLLDSALSGYDEFYSFGRRKECRSHF